jgi:demethylmacrocin O-methyltransferase
MTDLIRLIVAAGESASALDAAVESAGGRTCAELLVAEILQRCDPPAISEPVVIGLTLLAGKEKLSYGVRFDTDATVVAEPGEAADAVLRVSYDLAELTRELYGPGRHPLIGTRAIEQPQGSGPSSMGAWRSVVHAMNAFGKACSSASPSLSDLAAAYDSDKWGCLHWFTPHYEHHFATLREQPVRVLEIGIGGYGDPKSGGGSLRMWQRYFPRGLVYGLDIAAKPGLGTPRIRTLQGDQSDPAYLARLAEEYGPFDIVIDDGSHRNEHVLTSFQALFPHVRPRGFYVIEDLWTAYCTGYGGSAGKTAGSETSVGLVKRLVDALHYEETEAFARGDREAPYEARHVVGLHVYHNIAFLEKGVNAEGGIPAWVGREPY